MSATLITNIGELTTNVGPSTGSGTDGDPCGTMTDAAILVDGGRIVWVGSAGEAEGVSSRFARSTTGDRARDSHLVVDDW